MRALAQLITMVENRAPGSSAIIERIYAKTGRAQVVGITGPPGAGKSTLVNHLIAKYRALGKKIAILAIDPSSPFSGGAVLGDRVRMTDHYKDAGVYIRSLAIARKPRRTQPRRARNRQTARRLRQRRYHYRDRRRGTDRAFDNGSGRHHRRRYRARGGRRGAGDEGRAERNRRRVRGQQGRPRRRRPDQGRAGTWRASALRRRMAAAGAADAGRDRSRCRRGRQRDCEARRIHRAHISIRRASPSAAPANSWRFCRPNWRSAPHAPSPTVALAACSARLRRAN